MFSRKFIQGSSNPRKPFAHLLRFAANSHAEMFGSVEKSSGNDAGPIFFQQELAKSVSVSAGELREYDAPLFGSNCQQIFSRAQKILQKRPICFEQLFGARTNLLQIIQRDHADHFSRMRRHYSKQIVQAPHSLRERLGGVNPTATQS